MGMAWINVNELNEPPYSLTPLDKNGAGYKALLDSIKRYGILVELIVAWKTIVDGYARWEAAKDLGHTVVPCMVIAEMTKEQIIQEQILRSVRVSHTTPEQYRSTIVRLVFLKPELKLQELCEMIGKSKTWVYDTVFSGNLSPLIMMELQNIPLSNAVILSKMTPSQQESYLNDAKTLSHQQFVEKVKDAGIR